MAEHTPGPWRTDHKCGDESVLDADGFMVADCAIFSMSSRFNKKRPEGTNKANARIVAAAPDLLALVIQYRDDLRHPPSADSIERRLRAIEAAIAKAQA